MADFEFLENALSGQWVISAPKRAKRPNEIKGIEPVCPFCPGRENDHEEVYRVPIRQAQGKGGAIGDSNWKIRVVKNKYPFAPIHEIIVHTQDHHKGFDELPLEQNRLVLETFRQRYQTHQDKGQVYIFYNHGPMAGESLPHPHTQLAVIPEKVRLDIPILKDSLMDDEPVHTSYFSIFSPLTCQWPDEVWVRPKKSGRVFGEVSDEELTDLAKLLYRLIQIMDLRHGSEFPFNFYVYPGGDWYLRLIPRVKILGGFEVGTGVFVNTQDPKETNEFLKAHFENPDPFKIKTEQQAKYRKGV